MSREEIIYRSVDELVPYENNPRKNDGAVESVMTSIREFGFKVPIVIDENDVIVAGHTRLKASKKLGLKEVPTIVARDLTEEQIKAFRIADNKTGELAEWDEDLLVQELEELEGLFTGFDADEIDDLLGVDDLGENPYTDKVEIPHYEIEGDAPPLSALYDEDKTNALIMEIEASGVEPEEKEFLKKSANRHTVFNYKNIAEYYAVADEEMQELMERSALVIIDYENAIREGYVSLSQDVQQMIEEDAEWGL